MTRWVFVAGFLVALAACGGKLAPVPGNAGSSDVSNDESECAVAPLAASRACVPGRGREKSSIQIEIEGAGCLPCGAQIQPCAVAVNGSSITLSANLETCGVPQTCPSTCTPIKQTCQLPPLAAGTFTLELAGSGVPPRQLVIQPTGEVACTLSTAEEPAPPIDVTDYLSTCQSDADCTMITAGDSCAPCMCPNAAINVKSQARYESDVRAATSQCEASPGTVACSDCPILHAFCNSGVCDVTH